MSSRRKSTTPCMVLPAHVVEQNEPEEKTERKKEEEVEEEKGKEGAEEGPTAGELDQAVVVVPTPPDTGETPHSALYRRLWTFKTSLTRSVCLIVITDEPNVSAVEDSSVLSTLVKRGATSPPEDQGGEQLTQEQQCDAPDDGGADPAAVGAISLSKTPIMRMKTKSEPKRIAVSLRSADEAVEGLGGGSEGEVGPEQEPIEAPLGPMTPVEMLLHDSMNLLSPPPPLFQVLSAFQAQHTAAAAAQSQLLIPLSSIPSYSAAMDTNPLLGSTYKKFPYPSMAEINSLAAQTQFTEEQIKVWFSAQRLKHGVSWTPEEVEEARRKQFNGTVHTVPQTITVIPAHQLSAAANGLQSILQTCQIVGQPGLVFTQVGPGGNLPVTSPITLTVAGMPSHDLKRATTVQPPSLSPQVGIHLVFILPQIQCLCVCLYTFSLRPKKSKEQLAELKASYLKNHFVTDAEIARLMNLTNLTKGEIKKWFSDTRYNQRNSKNSHVIVFHDAAGTTIVIDSSDETPTSPLPPRTPPVKEKETRPKTWNPFPDFTLQKFKEKTPEQLVVLEESFEKGSTPSDEELSRLRTETKLTRREIDAWFTERRKMPSDLKDKNKKTPEQLHILKSAFVRTQWPTPEEYDQLAEESGLPRSYIVSWFGDSRYSWKNSNLKWFFQYQSGNKMGGSSSSSSSSIGRKRRTRNRGWGRSRTRKQPRRSASYTADGTRSSASKKVRSGREILKEYYLKYRFLNEQDLDELVTKTNMSYEQVREWFAEVQRRVETGSDPFQDSAAGRMDGDGGADEDDEGDEEDGDDTDDSEVWEPSRSVRKSLSVSED
uniref:Zinc fingers and homeoboxes protein 1 n=1 Tax=Mola mola TaxID=94237 RepID=A0A3Q4AQ66_MOLML